VKRAQQACSTTCGFLAAQMAHRSTRRTARTNSGSHKLLRLHTSCLT
jgi:hypothetical protein